MPDAEKKLLPLAAVASPRMKLDSMILIESSMRREPNEPSTPDVPLQCDFGFKVDHEFNADLNALVAHVHFYSRGIFDENGTTQPVFSVNAVYFVKYSIKGDEPLTDDAMEAFAKLNGVYNCWPYWREYTQSVTLRMGLPALTLPLITAGKIEKILEQSQSEFSHDDEVSTANAAE